VSKTRFSSLPAAEIQSRLSTWCDSSQRDLPWRESKEPYHVWLSEVILQQTRVEQGLPYFSKILARFPDIETLAAADIDDLLLMWEGLGYYSRARNLHQAARLIVHERGGSLPDSYESWLELPGVGPYTAAAISSIAHSEAKAVVDGNVIRVLTRLVALETDVGTARGKKEIADLADILLDHTNPGNHNEALMELGALVCTPRQPNCHSCPIQYKCHALAMDRVHDFPHKKPKKKVPHYDISVGIIHDDQDRIFIQRRAEDSMLGGLWEFPGGKKETGESIEETCVREVREEIGVEVTINSHFATINHAYSHFKISLHAFECQIRGDALPNSALPTAWVAHEHLADYAFPRANRRLLDLLQNSDEKTR